MAKRGNLLKDEWPEGVTPNTCSISSLGLFKKLLSLRCLPYCPLMGLNSSEEFSIIQRYFCIIRQKSTPNLNKKSRVLFESA